LVRAPVNRIASSSSSSGISTVVLMHQIYAMRYSCGALSASDAPRARLGREGLADARTAGYAGSLAACARTRACLFMILNA
jgi:hypothetical protein